MWCHLSIAVVAHKTVVQRVRSNRWRFNFEMARTGGQINFSWKTAMIIMITKASILIICPFPRGLVLTYPLSPPTNPVYILLWPLCVLRKLAQSPTAQKMINLCGQYHLVTEAIIRISAINGLLQPRAVACVNHLRGHMHEGFHWRNMYKYTNIQIHKCITCIHKWKHKLHNR